MEVKGRITKAGPLETKQKKDGSGSYTIFPVTVQIGIYNAVRANYETRDFSEVTMADEIGHNFFHDAAREAEKKYIKGEVVMVNFHHYIDQYGRTVTVIDSLHPCNARKVEQPKPQPQPAPEAKAEEDDGLPF